MKCIDYFLRKNAIKQEISNSEADILIHSLYKKFYSVFKSAPEDEKNKVVSIYRELFEAKNMCKVSSLLHFLSDASLGVSVFFAITRGDNVSIHEYLFLTAMCICSGFWNHSNVQRKSKCRDNFTNQVSQLINPKYLDDEQNVLVDFGSIDNDENLGNKTMKKIVYDSLINDVSYAIENDDNMRINYYFR